MTPRLPRYRTGDEELDRRVEELVGLTGASDGDLVFELVVSAVRLRSSPGP